MASSKRKSKESKKSKATKTSKTSKAAKTAKTSKTVEATTSPPSSTTTPTTRNNVVNLEKSQIQKTDIVKIISNPDYKKGQNVSGRSWKVRPQKRATSLINTKVNNQSKTWERRQEEKLLKQQAKQLQDELREERRQSKILKKERRLENEKRRAENEYKNQLRSAQTLNFNKVGSTLKAMSKKQLRQIKKTRINPKTGVTEFVPAYSK